MTRELVLTEYVPSEPFPLTTVERDVLRDLVPDLTVQPCPSSTDTYTLTSGSSVGVVSVGDLTVELRPKVGIAPVLFLVSYALDPRGWRPSSAQVEQAAGLAEAIVPLFATTVEVALRRGLLHDYRNFADTLPTVRGRIRIADQMRARTGLALPVEVAYDDFTPDILENQLLRSAVDTLGRLRLRHPSSRARLAGLHQQLNGISTVVPDGRDVPEPRWTRLNEHYRPAVSLARMILAGIGVEARSGSQAASAFLIDMNDVFEQFVRTALREQLRLDQSAFPSGKSVRRTWLDVERTVRLEPDLSWWAGRRCLFVGDCKYKRMNTSAPNDDIYQLLAYMTALDMSDGMLLYASALGTPPVVTIGRTGQRIHLRVVDVTQAPADVLAHVGAIAEHVQLMARRHQRELLQLEHSPV
ncbi:McrC family protein [Flindersiella endophytica]